MKPGKYETKSNYRSADTSFMKASIIIPTLNEEKTIGRCLKAVLGQKFDSDFEVVVVDSGSTDGTQKIIEKYPVVSAVIKPSDFGHGKTRDLAVGLARGEILVFLSSDAVPADEHWLQSLLGPLERDPGVGAVYSKQQAPVTSDPVNQFRMRWMYGDQPVVKCMGGDHAFSRDMIAFSNVGSAIPRQILEKHPFRKDMKFAEDTDLAYRLLSAGYKIVYEPSAKVWHAHNHTPGFAFKFCFDVAVSYKKSGILARMKHAENEGGKYIWEELKFLVKGKYYGWIPYALFFNLAQFFGFRIGCLESMIPRALKKHLSLFWYS